MLTRLTVAVAMLFAVTACSSDDQAATSSSTSSTTSAPSGPAVVVSTTWVGALAKVAGATNISVIVPATEKNPAAYKPTPGDLAKLEKAQFVFYATADPFGEQIKAAAGTARVDTVDASYEPNAMAAAIAKLGKTMGTEAAAEAGTTKLRKDLKDVQENVRNRLAVSDTPFAIANTSVVEWVKYPGWTLAKTFTAAATPTEIDALKKLNPNLVLEDASSPGPGAQIAQDAKLRRVDLSNYPSEKLDIVALAKDNAARMAVATEHR